MRLMSNPCQADGSRANDAQTGNGVLYGTTFAHQTETLDAVWGHLHERSGWTRRGGQ